MLRLWTLEPNLYKMPLYIIVIYVLKPILK